MDKDIQNLNNDSSLVRIDKNIANNPDAIALEFGQGNDELAMSLLIFCAWQRKTNLFDYGIIDPDKFAKTMGYAPKYLTSVHPNPACLANLNDDEKKNLYKQQSEHPEDPTYRVLDSRFENALYLLLSRNIIYRRPGKTYKIDGNVVRALEIKSVRLFKRFTILFKKSPRGKKKLLYDYELDEGFAQNLSLLYVTANIADFAVLRKKSLHKLYLYTKNMRETALFLNHESCQSNFDLLCQIADIRSDAPKDCKKRLVAAFKEIEKVIPINLRWEKRPGDKWAYLPIIIFNEVVQHIIPADKVDAIAEKVDVFCLNFFEYVCNAYKAEYGYEIYTGDREVSLERVLIDFLKKNQEEQIEYWYIQAQLRTFAISPNNKTRENFEILYSNLHSLSSYKAIKDFLYCLFKSQHNIIPSKQAMTPEELKAKYKNVYPVQIAPISEKYKEMVRNKNGVIININGQNFECYDFVN